MERRHEIGVGSMMFGNDYPHPEGNWGQAVTWIQATLGCAGVPEPEARMILGENAARLYHLDVDALAPIVERVGPTIQEVLSSAVDVDALLDEVDRTEREVASVGYRSQNLGRS